MRKRGVIMNLQTYEAVVKDGHVEINNLPVPDNTHVYVTIKTKNHDFFKEEKAEKIMEQLPKYKLGVSGSLRRDDIYDENGR